MIPHKAGMHVENLFSLTYPDGVCQPCGSNVVLVVIATEDLAHVACRKTLLPVLSRIVVPKGNGNAVKHQPVVVNAPIACIAVPNGGSDGSPSEME